MFELILNLTAGQFYALLAVDLVACWLLAELFYKGWVAPHRPRRQDGGEG